jgi:tetratricopeptide (TPR) repeat protein
MSKSVRIMQPGRKGQAASSPGGPLWLIHPAVIAALLAALTLAVYWPVVGCDFIHFDDHLYYASNPHVQAGLTWRGLLWSFQVGYAFYWHPLTWLSHMLDAELFGKGPFGPHLVNLIFHTANTVLLFVLFRRLTSAHWRSALLAALFALHPLHVESVAWVAERKDVLSAFFFMLTLLAYDAFAKATVHNSQFKLQSSEGEVQSPEHATRNMQHASRITRHASHVLDRPFVYYGLAILLFVLGLMSKPMLVTLPFLMLLLDYWPLRRFEFSSLKSEPSTLWRLVLEKAPFFLLSAAACLVTVVAQAKALQPLDVFSPLMRIENALVSYAAYLGKTFWPVRLALPYPHPGYWPALQVVQGGLVLAGLCGAVVWVGRRHPFVLTGIFWFLGLLVPVIGFVQAGAQAMADRFIYLPQTGLFLVLVWGGAEIANRLRMSRMMLVLVALLALGACAWRTRDQLRYWANSGTLFSHSVAVTQSNEIACYCLGLYYDDQGRFPEAIENYRQAIQFAPHYALAHLSLGVALTRLHQLDEASQQFSEAIRLAPDSPLIHNDLGVALSGQGQFELALAQFQEALRLQPDYVDAHRNLGKLLLDQGRYDEAITHYREALRLAPDAGVCNNLGHALAAKGQRTDAISCYRQALRLDPNLAEARNNLGNALLQSGQVNEAIANFRDVLRRNPKDVLALNNLGIALATQKQYPEAADAFQAAVRLRPDFLAARLNLADALAAQEHLAEAVAQCREALLREPDSFKAHFCLGRVLVRQRQTNDAIAQFSQALRLKPDFEEANRLLHALTGTTSGEGRGSSATGD